MESKFNKTKNLNVRLTEKQINLLDVIAEKHELKRSEFVRIHFINLLNKYKQSK